MLMLRPDPASLGPDTLMPLAAGALYGLGNLLTREWCADEPVGALLASFVAALGLIGAAGCLVLAPARRRARPASSPPPGPFPPPPPSAGSWPRPSRRWRGRPHHPRLPVRRHLDLAVFEYSFLLSASLWAFVLRGERLDAPGIAGIVLIIASGIIVAGASYAPRRLNASRLP